MIDIIDFMIRKTTAILNHAYTPYSNYRVAACICSDESSFFTGVNIENASYGLTICAESAAICQMVSAGKQKIKSLVILNGADSFCSPCGACRQRIAEFSTADTIIHLCNQQGLIKSVTIDELLPLAFRLKP